jgi:hypothetical protein
MVEGRTGLSFDHRARDPVGALASKLIDALTHWPRTIEIGHRAQLAAQRFSFRRVADEFLEDFSSLLAT